MTSGIQVNDNVKTYFEKMKVNKTNDNSDKRIRLVTCTIQNDEINVDKVFTQDMLGKDGVPEDAYLVLVSLLHDNACFYLMYDCHLETKEGIKKEELVFGTWIPEDIAVKQKMTYASSKQNVKNACKGVKHDVSVNDRATIMPREAFADCLERLTPAIVSLEGVLLSGGGAKK
ncbi:cofilin-2-like [Labrus mixtus]|uniref:cofilin-2-like n=1 Tax=Labrus mixtus TaxID=508554 RepID=UPI0029C0FF30|nr:cofilin-2-like [Labrus mixtus]